MRRIPVSGKVYDEIEKQYLREACEEFWLTSGKWTKRFEKGLADFLKVKYCYLVNSGSSANLLAFMALTSPSLKTKQIKRGDEIITTALCFPTTVAPIIQYGAVPVFVDCDLSGNIDVSKLELAISNKTKAVILAHTLGVPFNIEEVLKFCKKYNLWLIEDNCDALGSIYYGKMTGTFGDIGTSSFYPAHHITCGEGGAVYTNNTELAKIMLSMRDWGRDCSCQTGQDNKCGNRFNRKFGELPFGFDHKYVYSTLGYNLKATDLQAAIGCAQLEKLPDFNLKRRINHQYLNIKLLNLTNYFYFTHIHDKNIEPSWFGFLIVLQDDIKFTRKQIIDYLEQEGIQTRMLFAGNIIKQPCMKEQENFRVACQLTNTDLLMNKAFWVGVYPGLNTDDLDYIIDKIDSFVRYFYG